MKEWNKPELMEINVSETASGELEFQGEMLFLAPAPSGTPNDSKS